MAVRALYLLVSALLVVTVKTSIIRRDAWSPPREGSVRITGGHPAGVGQYPYQALIVSDDVEMWGGSLITRKAVLTSSGCTIGRQKFVVRLGGIHRTETESTAWIVESSWALTHPDFSMFAYYSHSVAVVYLPEEAPLNSFIGLVALPSPLEVNDTFVGENAIIAGWGWPSQNVARAQPRAKTLQQSWMIVVVGLAVVGHMFCGVNVRLVNMTPRYCLFSAHPSMCIVEEFQYDRLERRCNHNSR
ncbi:serine protease 44-like [Schistocerca americana]|uniref:serine protease 44-like n=1 Tax=Schistocerca americana TaxID=7009 RepID=UPI001F4F2205|nr:serine protease 44-like [Schistocerca americana]